MSNSETKTEAFVDRPAFEALLGVFFLAQAVWVIFGAPFDSWPAWAAIAGAIIFASFGVFMLGRAIGRWGSSNKAIQTDAASRRR